MPRLLAEFLGPFPDDIAQINQAFEVAPRLGRELIVERAYVAENRVGEKARYQVVERREQRLHLRAVYGDVLLLVLLILLRSGQSRQICFEPRGALLYLHRRVRDGLVVERRAG